MRIGTIVEAKDLESGIAGVRQANEDGFASAWFTQMMSFDAVTMCAFAGREFPNIEVGTAVVPTFPRHPHALAMHAVTASLATQGRFTLGIGLSHQMVIESMFGMSYDKPARHMREYLEVLIPLLREGKVDHDGDVYTVHAPVDTMGATPPQVLVAALGPAMLKITGELADGTITWMTGPKTLADHIIPTITKAASEPPRIVASLRVVVTNDPDDARERTGRAIAFYGSLPSYRAMLDREGATEPKDVTIVGDEDVVARAVRQLAEIGVTDFLAVPGGNPDELARTRKLLCSLSL
jgi:F420-dependent oxidoreductase-like protein